MFRPSQGLVREIQLQGCTREYQLDPVSRLIVSRQVYSYGPILEPENVAIDPFQTSVKSLGQSMADIAAY